MHIFRDKVAKKRCANMDPYVTVVVDEETFLRKERDVSCTGVRREEEVVNKKT